MLEDVGKLVGKNLARYASCRLAGRCLRLLTLLPFCQRAWQCWCGGGGRCHLLLRRLPLPLPVGCRCCCRGFCLCRGCCAGVGW
jgi:hypothetical protein